MSDKFKNLMDIYSSEHNGLAELAQVSGYDPCSFYRGSDLSGLDLSNQDLRGLNFDGADLRGSKLDGIDFDAGSLNKAIIDVSYYYYQDEFIFTIDEALDLFNNGLYFYGRFREETFARFFEESGMTQSQFANNANLSTSTIRSGRNERVLLSYSISKIIKVFNVYRGSMSTVTDANSLYDFGFLAHPMLELLFEIRYGEYQRATPERVGNLLGMR